MCADCISYEYSRNCGPQCSDHAYRRDEWRSDDEGTMFRCSRCGCCKYVDNSELQPPPTRTPAIDLPSHSSGRSHRT